MRRVYVIVAILIFFVASTHTATAQAIVNARTVVTGLDTPWEILWGQDGWIWMTERGGKVSRVNPATGEKIVIATLTDVHEVSESGLLGMVLHPSFADTPWVYVVYNYSSGGSIAEKLVRYRYNGTALVEPSILIDNIPGFPTHDGSRLLVTSDRKLLMTTGDAQDQPAAQNHRQFNGKILRMNLDGSPAADNPWSSAPYPSNYLWTTGHRNPQGLTNGPSGRVYSSEHGPDNDDEINIIVRGRNFGWPNVHGYCNLPGETRYCTDSNVVEPIKAWTPTTAVAGVEYYNHSMIPQWQHALLLTNLREADFRVLKLSADGSQIISETVLYDNAYGRLRDVAVAPDGRVFIATSNRDGRGRTPFPQADDDRIIEFSATIANASIDAPTILPPNPERGEQIQIQFSATGPFTVSNEFTAQLSDKNGSFAAPTILGTLVSLNGGIITTVLPCTLQPSVNYLVRIVSSSPVVTSPTTIMTIEESARPFVTPTDGRAFCAGESLQLNVVGGQRAQWSPSIGLSCTDCRNPVASPSRTTTYVVNVVDSMGCDVSDTVVLTVYDLPKPVVVRNGDTLMTSPGFVSYQWLRDSVPIPGATNRTYQVNVNGTYAVRVANENGCIGTSAPGQITNAGVAMSDERARDLVLTPQPVTDRLSLELKLGSAGNVSIDVVDLRGAVIRKIIIEAVDGVVRATIDFSDIAPGAYVVRISSDEETWTRTMIR